MVWFSHNNGYYWQLKISPTTKFYISLFGWAPETACSSDTSEQQSLQQRYKQQRNHPWRGAADFPVMSVALGTPSDCFRPVITTTQLPSPCDHSAVQSPEGPSRPQPKRRALCCWKQAPVHGSTVPHRRGKRNDQPRCGSAYCTVGRAQRVTTHVRGGFVQDYCLRKQ